MSKKDTSSKFFTLQFVDENEQIKTTKVPARKRKTLRESVGPIFVNNDLSFETHSVFLDASKTPIPFTVDTFQFGGSTLHVRVNEEADVDKRIATLMKNEEKKTQTVNKRYSDLLLHYETYGLEDDDAVDGEKDDIEEELSLEASWRDVITEKEDMPDKQKIQQEAIWELFTTEISFIKDLRIIIQIFQKCFKALQDEGYLTEVDHSIIFANIDEVYDVNITFWSYLKHVVENARASKEPIRPSQLTESFEEFEDLFTPYIKFCNEDPSNIKFPEYSKQTKDMLKRYLSWCDNHEKCMRIKLNGFLIKPLQRVTKYALLLKAILNKTMDEEEKCLVEEMMSRVETFVSKINTAVYMRQEQEKLISVLAKFDTYTPIEAVNDEAEKIMSEYSCLNLKGTIPGLPEEKKRFIIKDGPMKMVEKQGKKDVYAFLFTDVLVLAKLKRNTDKYRIIRQPFRLNKIIVRPLKDAGSFLFIYLNEYGVVVNAFVMQINPNEQAKWILAIEKAKKEYDSTRAENCLKEDFIDDDILSDVNRIRLNSRKTKYNRLTSSSSKSSLSTVQPFEWSNTKIFIAVTSFCILNAVMAHLFGYK